MTEEEAFDNVLAELRAFVEALRARGVACMLIGGQVLALQARARGGSSVIEVRTDTDVVVQRGYSMEPDLLLDLDSAPQRVDDVGEILRERGFKRVKTSRWLKETPRGDVLLDLFIPPNVEPANDPGYTKLEAGEHAFANPELLRFKFPGGTLEIEVPDPLAFLETKIAATALRPQETKDCFDIFAYSTAKGSENVAASLARNQPAGGKVARDLIVLFKSTGARGVKDVIAHASTLEPQDRELLARSAIDLFEDILRTFTELTR